MSSTLSFNTLRTSLFAEHQNLKAKFTPFAGYNMPVSYGAVKDEVSAVRTACGLFDVSHMLPISLKAASRDALVEALSRVCVRVPNKLKVGRAQYNALYNENAGLTDDVTLSALSDTHWLMVANAGNRQADVALLQKYISDTVKIEPWDNYTLLAVQGPDAPKLLEAKFPEIKNLYYYEVAFRGEDTFIARMGYTGEDGFEIACPQAEGIALWKELIAAGAKPCGLAARDVLRLEALMPLYGHELSSTLRPQESGLGFLYSDHTSIAPAALRNQATAQNSFGFQMQGEGIPRQGYKVVRESGEVVGEVTSGTFSFTQNCGMGFMRIDIAQKDKALFVEIRGEKKPIAVLEKTPIKGSVRRRPK